MRPQLLAIATIPVLLTSVAFAQQYALRMLYPLGSPYDQTYASGLDADGYTVGGSSSSTGAVPQIGIVRSADGFHRQMGSLAPCLPYGGSGLNDVSPGGRIAGSTSSVCGGYSLAASGSVLDPSGYVTYPPLPGGGDCAASGAADDCVVGWSNRTTGCGGFLCIQTTARAMKWYSDATAVELPISNFVVAIANGVNGSGVVVGRAYTAENSDSAVAVRWDTDASLPVTLPALDGTYGDALKISDAGVVVGQSALGAERHATRWVGTTAQDLGALPGHTFGIAYDIDDSRGIVGYSKLDADSTESTAVLWRDGQIIDLNSLVSHAGGVVLTSANGINSRGWIAANGIVDGKLRGFVLTPCPADLNNDGFVEDADFSIFIVAYNILDCADPAMPAGCPADLNNDNLVDDADFVVFVAAYNALLCP
ncbi:MAG: hypothetical protein KF691_16050 [Phycisphaeraceae bacterium]|nr:hypothetical protein [Phycisphaeraceae bacterium]